jgi:hypothetical protein
MINNSKYIISEFFEFSSSRELIKEAEEKGKPLIMTGILQKADTVNRNGRIYPYTILKREVDKYMELVESNTAGGELDHPDSAVVSLANVSHRVIDMWWQGNDLYGKVLVAEETEAGKTLKGLLKAGFTLGISSRGVGSVKSQSGKDIVQEDFELIAFDFVSSPSTPGAYLFKEGKEVFTRGMVPLKSEHYNLITVDSSEMKEQYQHYTKLFELANKDFWKNL